MSKKSKSGKALRVVDREYLASIIADKKIPVLTLDSRWNTLFTDIRKYPEIKSLVAKLNNLLKEQGGAVNKIKDMKKLKKKLMYNIVDNMGETRNPDENTMRGRKQEANHKLIGDINVQLSESEERLMELPYEIKRVNQELLLESMILCYDKINDNSAQVAEMNEWIENTKAELMERIEEKDNLEHDNNDLYTFMHDMVGAGVIDVFDSQFGKGDS